MASVIRFALAAFVAPSMTRLFPNRAMPQLLQQLKAAGYKVVHMVPKGQVTTIPKYDEMVTSQDKLSSSVS
jgi:hypothetical protein